MFDLHLLPQRLCFIEISSFQTGLLRYLIDSVISISWRVLLQSSYPVRSVGQQGWKLLQRLVS